MKPSHGRGSSSVMGAVRAPIVLCAGCCLLAGCGTSPPETTATRGPALSSPVALSQTIRADEAIAPDKGYDVTGPVVQTPDGLGQTLYAVHGTCHGSADGYCQIILFFIGSRYAGTDTASPSSAITSYRAAGTGAIAVTYPTYRKADPLCCPSGRPVTVTYRWNGKRLERILGRNR